jgi:hypothetical protein
VPMRPRRSSPTWTATTSPCSTCTTPTSSTARARSGATTTSSTGTHNTHAHRDADSLTGTDTGTLEIKPFHPFPPHKKVELPRSTQGPHPSRLLLCVPFPSPAAPWRRRTTCAASWNGCCARWRCPWCRPTSRAPTTTPTSARHSPRGGTCRYEREDRGASSVELIMLWGVLSVGSQAWV